MTVSISWIRTLPNNDEELWAISDSRLSTGTTLWDQCTKIFVLPNTKVYISFAGDTNISFPLINQIQTSIMAHRSSMLGYLDINKIKNHIVNVINSTLKDLREEVSGYGIENNLYDTQFIIGGYSWQRKKFSIYRILYRKQLKQYVADREGYCQLGYLPNCAIIGDITSTVSNLLKCKMNPDHYQSANEHRKLAKMFRKGIIDFNEYSREKESLNKNIKTQFDMEPFEVVRDLLKEKVTLNSQEYPSIGGAPQLIKVYQHMNSQPIGVFWSNDRNLITDPDKLRQCGTPNILGRNVLDYENTDYMFMDIYSEEARLLARPNTWSRL